MKNLCLCSLVQHNNGITASILNNSQPSRTENETEENLYVLIVNM
jgi:hypothetical protein